MDYAELIDTLYRKGAYKKVWMGEETFEFRSRDQTAIDAAYAIESLQASVAELDAEIDALRADAERYQWLRGRYRVFGAHIDGQHAWAGTGDIGRLRGPTLDAAIDAALAARPVD